MLSGAASAGFGGLASSLLTGCPASCPPFGQWNNAVATESTHPSLIMFPTSAEELVGVVKQAESAKKRVRMTGSGHSFSDIALTDDFLLLSNRLDSVLALDRNRLKAPHASDPRLVRVEAGITIRKLNTELDQRGLALENLGGYDGQTIAGVCMTATHGSGLAYGPIASQVVSLQLVSTGGKVIQIEPTDGITDKKSFSGTLEEDPRIKVRLVQHDDWFYAALVSMGCMGVVYSLVLRAVDKFWIRERRSIVPWSELAGPDGIIDRLVSGKPLNDEGRSPDHYEIYVNPYTTRRAPAGPDHTCIYTERYRFSTPPVATEDSAKRGRAGIGHLLANALARHVAEESLRTFLDGTSGELLYEFHDGLLEFLEDDDYTDLSYKVYNLGDANRFRVYGVEMAFGLEQTVAATERLFQLATWNEAQKRNHSVPVSLRFVAPSRSPVAMQYGRATCMMEIGMLVGQYGAGALLQSYETTFIREFGARPHWGLDLDILKSEADVARLYPAWPSWKAVYAELNKKGTFDGKVTDRLGISMVKR